MINYLTKEQFKSKLAIGSGIEQWLGFYTEDDEVILKWIRIYQEKGDYNVMYIECYDQGNFDYIDIYDFTVADPDEPYGIITTFSSIDEAIDFSVSEYGASKEKFVNGGMIQQEYLSYLNSQS